MSGLLYCLQNFNADISSWDTCWDTCWSVITSGGDHGHEPDVPGAPERAPPSTSGRTHPLLAPRQSSSAFNQPLSLRWQPAGCCKQGAVCADPLAPRMRATPAICYSLLCHARAFALQTAPVAAPTSSERGRTRASALHAMLDGTSWRLTLDVGREPGTWMPKEWAASGATLRRSRLR